MRPNTSALEQADAPGGAKVGGESPDGPTQARSGRTPGLGPVVFVDSEVPGIGETAAGLAVRIGGLFAAVPGPEAAGITEPRESAAYYYGCMADAIEAELPLVLLGPLFDTPAREQLIGAARMRLLRRAALTLDPIVVSHRSLLAPTWAETWLDVTPAGIGLLAERLLDPRGSGSRTRNVGPGCGLWNPGGSVLIVADRPNSAMSGSLKHRFPFFSLADDAGVSLWLAEQLESAGIPEQDLYWVNAYDASGEPTDAAFVDELDPRRVVALGKAAAEWCESRLPNRRPSTVPSPSSWRKAHGDQYYPLPDAFR